MKRAFPADRLRPLVATLSGTASQAQLEIPLAHFELDGVVVETSIYLEGLRLPTVLLSELAGRSFSFPSNPKSGYIDGSVCIQHTHHPVDVTSIAFGALSPQGLQAKLAATFLFEFEGLNDYANTSAELRTIVGALHAQPGVYGLLPQVAGEVKSDLGA